MGCKLTVSGGVVRRVGVRVRERAWRQGVRNGTGVGVWVGAGIWAGLEWNALFKCGTRGGTRRLASISRDTDGPHATRGNTSLRDSSAEVLKRMRTPVSVGSEQ